jgi:hypothetical protein
LPAAASTYSSGEDSLSASVGWVGMPLSTLTTFGLV